MPLFPPQKKPLLIGLGLLLVAAGFIVLIWLGTFLPGFAGEAFSKMAGIMWTPVFLDLSLFLLGLSLVLWLNKYRLERDGDEFVYLEQVNDPEAPANLPADARSALYKTAPETLGEEPTLAAIEGALALDDLKEATHLLLQLSAEALETPEALALRISLAQRNGKASEAATLLETLRLKAPKHPLCSES